MAKSKWHDWAVLADTWYSWGLQGLMPPQYQISESSKFAVWLFNIKTEQRITWDFPIGWLDENHPGVIQKLSGPHGLTVLQMIIARRENEGPTEGTT